MVSKFYAILGMLIFVLLITVLAIVYVGTRKTVNHETILEDIHMRSDLSTSIAAYKML